MFLWHYPRGRPHWALPSTLPCGARTFLECPKAPAAARPAPGSMLARASRGFNVPAWDAWDA
jgi:hypothetical protein